MSLNADMAFLALTIALCKKTKRNRQDGGLSSGIY